ncbi:MAG: type II secretion system protein N [Lysobacterales bacterium]
MNLDLRDWLLHDARARPLAIAVVAIAAAACLYLLVQWLWLVLRWSDDNVPIVASAAPAAMVAAPTDRLSRLHLFGSSAPVIDQRSLADNAPDSASQLVLRGVFAASDPRAGRAIIAGPDQKEGHYAVGAELPGHVELAGVYADRVVISNGGVLEVLRLPRQGGAMGAPVSGNFARGVSPSTLPAANPAPTASPVDFLAGAGGAAPLMAPMSAGAFGAAATGLGVDPTALARDVRLEPVLADGKQTGVRVVSSNAALLEKLGLQPGDEVTSVNGIALDNPLRGVEVMQALGSAQSASITVKRGGQQQTLSVVLR